VLTGSQVSSTNSSTPTALSAVPVPPSPTATAVSVNLSNSVIDKDIPLPPNVKLPIEIKCANCSTFGSLDITQGKFEVDASLFDGDGFSFSAGSVTLAANNVGAYLELEAIPKVSGSFTAPIPSIPIPGLGFSIPGFGKAGVTFTPAIAVTYQVNGGLSFTYGLESQIPNGSNITINFSDFGESSVSGFDKTTIKSLPFNTNVSSVELTVHTAFTPQIQFGFSFNLGPTANVGVFADLPFLEAKFSNPNNVDANCVSLNTNSSSLSNSTGYSAMPSDASTNLSPTQTTAASVGTTLPPSTGTSSDTISIPPSASSSLLSQLGSLVLVEATAGIDIGLEAQYNLIPGASASAAATKQGVNQNQDDKATPTLTANEKFNPLGVFEAQATHIQLFSTDFPLVTSCLAFQPSATGFLPAKQVWDSLTSSYISSVSSVSAASASAASASAAAKASEGGGIFAPSGTGSGKTATGAASGLGEKRMAWLGLVLLATAGVFVRL
jgi:hypothetical protein